MYNASNIFFLTNLTNFLLEDNTTKEELVEIYATAPGTIEYTLNNSLKYFSRLEYKLVEDPSNFHKNLVTMRFRNHCELILLVRDTKQNIHRVFLMSSEEYIKQFANYQSPIGHIMVKNS